jgi:hypothetical protein
LLLPLFTPVACLQGAEVTVGSTSLQLPLISVSSERLAIVCLVENPPILGEDIAERKIQLRRLEATEACAKISYGSRFQHKNDDYNHQAIHVGRVSRL